MSSNISSRVPINEKVVIRMIEKEAHTLVSEYPGTFQGFSILNLVPPENSEHLDDFVPCIHDMMISLSEAAVIIDTVSDHKIHDSNVFINGTECKQMKIHSLHLPLPQKRSTYFLLLDAPVTVRLNSVYSASVNYAKNPSWAFFAKFDQFLLVVM